MYVDDEFFYSTPETIFWQVPFVSDMFLDVAM